MQNVGCPIRLSDTVAAPKLHKLYIKVDGKIKWDWGPDPTRPIFSQPREVVFLLMFPYVSKDPKLARNSLIAGTFSGCTSDDGREITVDRAGGSWTGKLVTGDDRSRGGGQAAAERQRREDTFPIVAESWRRTEHPRRSRGRLGDRVKSSSTATPEIRRDPREEDGTARAGADAARDWTQIGGHGRRMTSPSLPRSLETTMEAANRTIGQARRTHQTGERRGASAAERSTHGGLLEPRAAGTN